MKRPISHKLVRKSALKYFYEWDEPIICDDSERDAQLRQRVSLWNFATVGNAMRCAELVEIAAGWRTLTRLDIHIHSALNRDYNHFATLRNNRIENHYLAAWANVPMENHSFAVWVSSLKANHSFAGFVKIQMYCHAFAVLVNILIDAHTFPVLTNTLRENHTCSVL